MNMIITNAAKLFYIFVITIAVSGCTSIETKKANVNIESESSSLARIFNVIVISTESGVMVSGTLDKRFHSRTVIPGHVDILFLSPEGEVLHQLQTDYRRSSIKSRHSKFRVEVPLILPEGSTVRVVHHKDFESLNGEYSALHQNLKSYAS